MNLQNYDKKYNELSPRLRYFVDNFTTTTNAHSNLVLFLRAVVQWVEYEKPRIGPSTSPFLTGKEKMIIALTIVSKYAPDKDLENVEHMIEDLLILGVHLTKIRGCCWR